MADKPGVPNVVCEVEYTSPFGRFPCGLLRLDRPDTGRSEHPGPKNGKDDGYEDNAGQGQSNPHGFFGKAAATAIELLLAGPVDVRMIVSGLAGH